MQQIIRRACLAALFAAGGALLTLGLPTYSADWPERVNLEYWRDADTGQSHYLARCDSLRLPAALAAAAHFDPVPRPRFAFSRRHFMDLFGFSLNVLATDIMCIPRTSGPRPSTHFRFSPTTAHSPVPRRRPR